jgi:hypothetical protein
VSIKIKGEIMEKQFKYDLRDNHLAQPSAPSHVVRDRTEKNGIKPQPREGEFLHGMEYSQSLEASFQAQGDLSSKKSINKSSLDESDDYNYVYGSDYDEDNFHRQEHPQNNSMFGTVRETIIAPGRGRASHGQERVQDFEEAFHFDRSPSAGISNQPVRPQEGSTPKETHVRFDKNLPRKNTKKAKKF